MKTRLLAVLALGVIAMSLTLSAEGQGTPGTGAAGAPQALGQIKAVRVVGDVTVRHGADQTAVAVKDDDALVQGDTIVTAKNASVVLVFSNGSTVSLAGDSQLAIDQFLQDPFGQEIKVADLTAEPTTSHTKLNLTYGELVGNVKKLKGDSSFIVQTPVGAAGIRGTTFMLTYRPSGTGQAFFTLSTASGEIIFQGTTGAPVPVPANKAVEVQVTVDTVTGAVQSVQVQSTEISTAAKQTIETQVTQALATVATTTFTTTTTNTNTNTNEQNNQQNQQNQNQQNQPQQQTPPRTTPGDGGTG
jgi:hypothetical protein